MKVKVVDLTGWEPVWGRNSSKKHWALLVRFETGHGWFGEKAHGCTIQARYVKQKLVDRLRKCPNPKSGSAFCFRNALVWPLEAHMHTESPAVNVAYVNQSWNSRYEKE